MRVTREFLEGYTYQLNALGDVAETSVVDRLSQRWLQMREEGVPVSEIMEIMRDEAGALLTANDETLGVASATLGAESFNATLEGRGSSAAHSYDVMKAATRSNEASARYWAKFLDGTEEGFDRFLGGLCAKTRRNVTHAADRGIADMALVLNRSGNRRGVRFARIPSGPSCGFCTMLASRGFVYATRESAGEFTRFHDNCDCRIVAGPNGIEVEGYDPDALYQRYAACVRTVNGGKLGSSSGAIWDDWERLPEEERERWGKKAKNGKDAFNAYFEHRVVREMDTRDREWLWSGKPAPVKYEKPREALEEHERAGVDHLSKNGISVTVKNEVGGAAANIDFEIRGKPVELKNVTNASSASNQVKRARIKWWKLGIPTPMQAVFTSEGTSVGFLQTVAEIEKRLRADEEAVIVSDDGLQLRRIKK